MHIISKLYKPTYMAADTLKIDYKEIIVVTFKTTYKKKTIMILLVVDKSKII